MIKKFIPILAGFAVLSIVSIPAFAQDNQRSSYYEYYPVESGHCAKGDYGFMMDDNGDFLSEKAFEDRLDVAIERGDISKSDREYYLNMYENCTENKDYRRSNMMGSQNMMGRRNSPCGNR